MDHISQNLKAMAITLEQFNLYVLDDGSCLIELNNYLHIFNLYIYIETKVYEKYLLDSARIVPAKTW
jgi:hypothetical protein